MNRIKKGFTLAEILITLLIIGVIASIVIPSLIADTQNAEYKTAWKKAFADFSQVHKRVVSDNASSIAGAFSSDDTMRDAYITFLNTTKLCNSGSSKGICWHNDGTFYYLNGTAASGEDLNIASGAILTNGSLVRFECRGCGSSYGIAPFCGDIQIDINGFKKPNKFGKDIYQLWPMADGRLLPSSLLINSSWDPSTTCKDGDTSASNTGYSCSVKYLNE
jgi:prepilin-type N-terminal cleavage/methylation domain-containing protein